MSSPASPRVVKRCPLGNFITGWVRRPDRFCLPCEESCEYFGPGEKLNGPRAKISTALGRAGFRAPPQPLFGPGRLGPSSRAQRAALGKRVGLWGGGWPRRVWRLVLTVRRVLSFGRGYRSSGRPLSARHPKAHDHSRLVAGLNLRPERGLKPVVAGSGDAFAPRGLSPLGAGAEGVGGADDVAAARRRLRHVVHWPGVTRVARRRRVLLLKAE